MNKKKIISISIFIILLISISLRSLFLFSENKDKYLLSDYDTRYETLKEQYYTSQYVQKINPNIIRDETFESFAAGAFLKGLNPILLVHDHPPLGRYILSLSIFLFENENTIMIFLLIASALGIYLLSYNILKSHLISLIPLGIFLNEPLFTNKIIYTPLPEPVLLPFVLFTLYFFIKGINSEKYLYWFIFSSICLGFVISIRFFVLGLAIFLIMGLFVVLKYRVSKKTITYFATVPLAGIILLFSYLRTMQLGSSPLQILGIQKYILSYHDSKFVLPFTFWDLLFFNRWHTWWGEWKVVSDSSWIILWPLSALLSGIYMLFKFYRKLVLSDSEKIIFSWVGIYCLMLSTGYTSTRYFLFLIPFLYILSCSFLYKLIKLKIGEKYKIL